MLSGRPRLLYTPCARVQTFADTRKYSFLGAHLGYFSGPPRIFLSALLATETAAYILDIIRGSKRVNVGVAVREDT